MRITALVWLMMLLAGQVKADAMPADTDAAQQVISALPEYQSKTQVSGRIRLWGHGSFRHDFMRKLISAWMDEFHQFHPQVEFEYRMYGTASAVGAVYTGVGEIAILGEEISPAAARAFERARGYPHTDITIATGSLDVNFFDYAHMIFVHRDNPVERLSLRELDAIFGAEHRRSEHNIRRWGDLGLEGEWRDADIQPYGWKTDVDFALFFRERVLGNSHRWNPAMREYVHARHADGRQYDHGQRIIDALAADPHGIAISNLRYARDEVKVVPLAWEDHGPAVLPTDATLISQQYPLVRLIPAIVDKPPGMPLPAAVREFLRFVLSRSGQQIVVRESSYLPLSRQALARQREKLE